MRATGPPKRPFLGEDIARGESPGLLKLRYSRMASDGEVVVSHGVLGGATDLKPSGEHDQPTLFCQIFGDGAQERISLSSPVNFGSRSINA